MRGIFFLTAMTLGVVPAVATRNFTSSGGADTTVLIENTALGIGLVVTAQEPIQAYGTGTGVLGEADYYGVQGEAYNGTGVKGIGYTGVWGVGQDYGSISEASSTSGIGALGTANGASGAGVAGTSSGSYGKGVYGFTGSTSGAIGAETLPVGVKGYSNAETGFGVVGEVYNDGVGVYSYSHSSAPAGYFDGDFNVMNGGDAYFQNNVAIGGVCSPCVISDRKFKKNIHALKGGLAKVKALRPATYEMRDEEYKGSMGFEKGLNYGLIADEVKQVIPEIVHPVKAPRQHDGKGKWQKESERLEFEAVNYSNLVPVLISAIQELEAEVAALKKGR